MRLNEVGPLLFSNNVQVLCFIFIFQIIKTFYISTHFCNFDTQEKNLVVVFAAHEILTVLLTTTTLIRYKRFINVYSCISTGPFSISATLAFLLILQL